MQINYISNPLQNMALWKRHQGVGSDFKIPSWNWEIEAKYSNAKVFPSWIDRSWLSRFNIHSFKVVVHNKGMKLPTRSLELCFLHDVYLVEFGYLKYVLKNKMKEANKVIKPISTNRLGVKSVEDKSLEAKGMDRKPRTRVSPSFRDKLRWKMKRKISKFIAKSLKFEPFFRFLSKLWNDKHGSVTLASWITIKPKIKKPKDKTRRRLFQCPFRTIILCPHYKQFYACLYQILIDYESHLEQYGFSEEQIDRMTDRLILDKIWKYKNLILTRCKCRPESIIDNEITSRIPIPRYGIASLDPCKSYRCPELIKEQKCEWLELLKENRPKPFQSKIPNYLEVKTQ
jgi:hypothetical protein